jgi:F-type H+-transporting ATPase subunit delta
MSESIVAYRYAKSLIELANERKVTDEVNNDMSLFKQVCQDNRLFLAAMSNPIIRGDKKVTILKKIFEKNVNPVTFSIFNVLTKKHREALIYSIADEFQKLYDIQNGIQKVTVTSSVALTDEQRKSFTKLVTDSTKKQVELEEKVNENLIGGYVLRMGDSQIDTSIKKKLNDLKLTFVN